MPFFFESANVAMKCWEWSVDFDFLQRWKKNGFCLDSTCSLSVVRGRCQQQSRARLESPLTELNRWPEHYFSNRRKELSPSMSGLNAAPKRKEIYKYEAPWTLYSMNWSVRPDKRFRYRYFKKETSGFTSLSRFYWASRDFT